MSTIQEHRARALAVWSDTSWEEVATYIGPNADKFRPIWEKQRKLILADKNRLVRSFCWPAFWMSFVWFFYRKQWLIGTLLILAPIVLFYIGGPGSPIGIGIVVGCIANSTYLQDVMPKIARLKAQVAPGDSFDAIARGGRWCFTTGRNHRGNRSRAVCMCSNCSAYVWTTLTPPAPALLVE